MIVEHRKNTLTFQALNDVKFVLSRLPGELESRKATLPASTKVCLDLEIDGIFVKTVPFKRDSGEGKADISSVQRQLGLTDNAMSVNSVHAEQTFSVRVKLNDDCGTLGECTPKGVVELITTRLDKLKKAGLRLQEARHGDLDD